MRINMLHAWDVTPQEAIHLQQQFTRHIQLVPIPQEIHVVAGADISYQIGSDQLYAGIVVLRFPDLMVIEEAIAVGTVSFPYIPGLLSFREAPMLLKAFQKLATIPDVVIFDGQGIAHPRGIGIASHVGLFLDIPSIGCAKSRLIGIYKTDALSKSVGACVALTTREGREIGAVVRTKTNINPVFVSPGFKADIPSSVEVVLKCCQGYKLPEPTRLAHQLVNRARREQSRQ